MILQNEQLKELGQLGANGVLVQHHAIQDLEPEQGVTLVANHALEAHQIPEIATVSGLKNFL